MIKTFFKAFKYLSLFGIFILSLLIFIPRKYDVPQFKPRVDVKYWELKSGSKIGYFFLQGVGQTDKPPIVYLHGGPGGIVHDNTINLLRPFTKQGFDIYLYDQIGSGHSSRLQEINEYTVERHQEDLEEILDIIDAEKVIFFAHSWGTMLAFEFFSEHQSKIDRMIFSGPGPILPINQQVRDLESPDSLNLIAPKYSNREANQNTYSLRSKFINYWANIFQSKLASDEEVDQFFTLLNGQLSQSTTCNGSTNINYTAGGGYFSHIMTLKSFSNVKNKRDKVGGNTIPLLILRGQCDNQKWAYTQEYMDLFSKSELHIIKSAGHKIEESRHQEYIEIITEFLK
ncbi:MAG: alpha/beta hydrolase [Bacteroidia bacterium]